MFFSGVFKTNSNLKFTETTENIFFEFRLKKRMRAEKGLISMCVISRQKKNNNEKKKSFFIAHDRQNLIFSLEFSVDSEDRR